MTHTPGPWQARDGLSKWNVTTVGAPRTFNICAINTDRTEQEANARLIAAAPDMLRALKDIMRLCCAPASMENRDAISQIALNAVITLNR